MEFTGERVVPGKPEINDTYVEHISRYIFAKDYIKGKTVLDAGCGCGYGTYYLAGEGAKKVVGVDISEEAIRYSKEHYKNEKLEFKVMDCTNLSFPDNSFDVVVSFELIEHIPGYKKYLSEVRRVLKEDGMFIVSTPNKKIYSDGAEIPWNEFHVKEFYLDEFQDLLMNYFDYVEIYNERYLDEFLIKRQLQEMRANIRDLTQKLQMIGGLSPEESIQFSEEIKPIKLTLNEVGIDKIDIENALYFVVVCRKKDTPKNKKIKANPQKKENLMKEVHEYSKQLKNEIKNYNSIVKLVENKINEKDRVIEEKDKHINALWNSKSLRFARKIGGIKERIFPIGTRRRRYYDLGLGGARIIVNEGFRSFLSEFKKFEWLKSPEVEVERDNIPLDIHLEYWEGEKILFPKCPKKPEVSIIIPVYNKFQYTFNCLKSLLKYTEGSYEVIIVDDASKDDTAKLLKNKTKNIRYIQNKKNLGFIESCNRAAKVSKGKYILFLNNDTVVMENWFKPLLETIKKKGVGAVSSNLIYPNGKIVESGSIVFKDGSAWNYGRDDDPNKPEYNFVREIDYCSATSLIMSKKLFEIIGGFDKRYRPAYYEDIDLCFSIRKQGYKTLYQPKSVVIHFEGITGGTDLKSGTKKYQVVNATKFYKKWKNILEKEQYERDYDSIFYARNRKKGKNIFVLDMSVPTFDKDSGSYRMYNLLKILSKIGHKVTFASDNLIPLKPYTSILQQHGIEVIYSPYIDSIDEYLSKNGKYFDIVFLSREEVANKNIEIVLKYCENAKIIYDTVDLHFLRQTRQAETEKDNKLLEIAKKTKKIELKLAKKSDITLVVSPIEKELMLKEDPSLKIEVISNIHKITPPEKSFSERKDIMFLGGFLHPPNIDAVKWFVKEIFPLIKEKIPGIKFYIVGSEPPKDIKSLGSNDIIVTGYVKDLTPYFENCRVSVSPLRYGAGVKGKINQSMSYGLPVVTTSIGAEGMGLIDGMNTLIVDEPEEFAEKVVVLYENEEIWNKISRNSIKNVQENFSPEVIKERIKNIFIE